MLRLRAARISLMLLACVIMVPQHVYSADDASLDYEIELTTIRRGYDGKMCWVHARGGTIPPRTDENPSETPVVVVTTQKLLLTGSDVFYGLNVFRTDDLGKTWSDPVEQATLRRRAPAEGREVVPCDFTPKWHAKTGKLLGTGATFVYSTATNAILESGGSDTSYSVYDAKDSQWREWKTLEKPADPFCGYCRAGCTQRIDLPDGDILLPIYSSKAEEHLLRAQVVRCRFDGEELKPVEYGNLLKYPTGRGFAEPSLTKFGEKFYLTLRNDDHAAVAASDDGLQFSTPKPWTFDDGQPLGSYNTQAHWVTHSDGLYLVYTRRGANNDHVFRHRAPLFIAEVDPEKLHVRRKTERILVPQRGARLGNFGVTNVSKTETWVTVTEWMQKNGPDIIIPVDNKWGADNSVYAAKIRWNKPNRITD